MSSWPWSHTQGALIDARDNVMNLKRETLAEIWSEWRGHQPSPNLPRTALANDVWHEASKAQRCTVGGHEAYICPTGCHTVPFRKG